MKIAIDISEETYKATCNGCMLPTDVQNVVQAIKNGTPLEKSKDCISRKAATDRFDLVQADDLRMSYDDILAFLLSLPSVEPEIKTGKCSKECCDVCFYSDEGQASPSVRMMGCKRRVSYEMKKGYEQGFIEGQKNPLFGEGVKLIFKKGDEIKYIYSEDKFVVLYVDDVNDLMYVMDSEGHIDTIDIFDADKYGLTGARYRIELTPDISLVSDKKESIDILKMEIQKINYELDRIVKELHALNKKK